MHPAHEISASLPVLHNRYYVCPQQADRVIAWDPCADDPPKLSAFVEQTYLGDTFRALEADGGVVGRSFYITWNVEKLPTYGDDVVVFLLGDEWCRVPAYADRVGAIFRQYGSRPVLVTAGPSALTCVLALQYLRLHVVGLRGRARRMCRRVRASGRAGQAVEHVIPLGYGAQLELPLVPIAQRPVDVYFSGSVTNRGVPPWSPPSPKRIARERMLVAAHRLKEQRDDLRVVLDRRDSYVPNQAVYGDGAIPQDNQYSTTLMNTKICLAPRGSSPDTMRLFEGLRYGCVVIADRLPSTWFYRKAPIVMVDDWRSIDTVVTDLLSDGRRLHELHQSALEFWHARCSSTALAWYVTKAVSGQRDERATSARTLGRAGDHTSRPALR